MTAAAPVERTTSRCSSVSAEACPRRCVSSSLAVDLENLTGVHPALVDRARGDCQTQRVAREHRTEISARSQHPAPAVEVGSEPDEFFGGFAKVIESGIILSVDV